MTKNGSVVCRECNWSSEEKLPDNQPKGFSYLFIEFGVKTRDVFLANIMIHHLDTHLLGDLSGHRDFDVFLEDGGTGHIEGNSYSIIYTEHGNKEKK